MSDILGKIFKSQIERTFGNDFEEFIKDFFLIYYGNGNFISTRKVKDDGSDGNLNSESAIIACYGPGPKATKANFRKKSKEDYSLYVKKWSNQYVNWWFIHNRDNSPDAIRQIKSLGNNTKLLGIEELVKMFEDMNKAKQRKIARLLNIGEEYFARQYVKEIIEDILQACEGDKISIITYKRPLYIDDKIKLNFSEEQVDQMREEFSISLEVFGILADILSDYEEDGASSKLKSKVLYDLSLIAQGDLKYKINALVEKYEALFSYSDDYLYYLKAFVLYLFEQCLFGIKTEQEKIDDNSSP